MFVDLDDLIEQGEKAKSVSQLSDNQSIFDWIYEVESYLIENDLMDDEIKGLIEGIKDHADAFYGVQKLLGCLKSKKKTLRVPEITERNQIFVAMWFSDEMKPFYDDGYVPAIRKCNYACRRIDEKQFNGSIIEEIVKDIGNSIFLIADLTGNRGGVYYEAGIAKGLRLCKHPIQLILTCRADYFHSTDNKPHFDVSGDNIIEYSTPEELKNKLITRIKGTEDN